MVVLGGGFGGLAFCQHFRHPSARVTVVDRTNHHLIQPLLYQVATAGLSAPEIAQPIRSILAHRPEVTVLLDQVVDLNLVERQVFLEKSVLRNDYLVVALGGCTSYFGHLHMHFIQAPSSYSGGARILTTSSCGYLSKVHMQIRPFRVGGVCAGVEDPRRCAARPQPGIAGV